MKADRNMGNHKMERLARIKKLASLLLLICLLLPLSQCSDHAKKETITVHYGYEMLTETAKELFSDEVEWDILFVIVIYISFFFAPLITLALKSPAQQITALVLAFPAGYAIFIHLFFMNPRIGIWLATLLWLIVVGVSLLELYQTVALRRKRKTKEMPCPDNSHS